MLRVGRVAWATDIHLDHARDSALSQFATQVRSRLPGGDDLLVVSGDVSNGKELVADLRWLAGIGPQVAFVLGNHDLWGSSRATVRETVSRIVEENERLVWLERSDPIWFGGDLNDRTVMIGADGWYDLRNGLGEKTRVVMHDWLATRELLRESGVKEENRLFRVVRAPVATCRRWADASAERVKMALSGLPVKTDVVVVTHVPPWESAATYRGTRSDPAWQAVMTSRVMGETIERVARERDLTVTVLCGHSHGGADVKISDRVRCVTGEARYRRPRVQELSVKSMHSEDYI